MQTSWGSERRPRAAFAMRPGLEDVLFDANSRARINSLVDIDFDANWQGEPGSLPDDVEVLLTGWDAPRISVEVLDSVPRLRAVLHAGGTVRSFIDEQAWRRNIRVTSAAGVNALPVAQFAAACIVLGLKNVLGVAHGYAHRTTEEGMPDESSLPGVHNSVVGIIGASRTGRATIQLLRSYGCRILVADPFLDAFAAAELGVERVELDELFVRSQVVSVHAPDLPATRGMVNAPLLASLRDGATLINTARPALIDQDALLDELRTGRLCAILDVTDPEPLPVGHELLRLPNVLVTPHLAGAHGSELRLLGGAIVNELERLLAGEDAHEPVRLEELESRA